MDLPKRTWPAAALGIGRRSLLPNLFDVIVFIIIAAGFVALAYGRAGWVGRSVGSTSRP